MIDFTQVYARIAAGQMTLDEFDEWVSEQRADAVEYAQEMMSEYCGYGE